VPRPAQVASVDRAGAGIVRAVVKPWRHGLADWMLEDEAAWWAKLQRAREHHATLSGLVADYLATEPYTLDRETVGPTEAAYRLHIHDDAPVAISTVVGDLVHNLRSALDALAYSLAEHSVDKPLNSKQRRATMFPVCRTPEDYEEFFDSDEQCNHAARVRSTIYGPEARAAMRIVQPFALVEQTTDPSDTELRAARYDEGYRWSAVARITTLHSIDKHRRLNTMAIGWPLMYVMTDQPDEITGFGAGDGFGDGLVLIRVFGPKAVESRLHHDPAVVLLDDPMHRPMPPAESRDCRRVLGGWIDDIDVSVRRVLSEVSRLTTTDDGQ
jgi:hypothetical protein